MAWWHPGGNEVSSRISAPANFADVGDHFWENVTEVSLFKWSSSVSDLNLFWNDWDTLEKGEKARQHWTVSLIDLLEFLVYVWYAMHFRNTSTGLLKPLPNRFETQ